MKGGSGESEQEQPAMTKRRESHGSRHYYQNGAPMDVFPPNFKNARQSLFALRNT